MISVTVNGSPWALTVQDLTSAMKADLLATGIGVQDFAVDSSVYNSAPNSLRADLIAQEYTDFPPAVIDARVCYTRLIISEQTILTFQTKLTSGALRPMTVNVGGVPTDVNVGGILYVTATEAGSGGTPADVLLGGWRDWAEQSMTFDPGDYTVFFFYFDAPVEVYGITEWPDPPEGVTATDDCWLDTFAVDVSMFGALQTVCQAYPPGPYRTAVPLLNTDSAAETPSYLVGVIRQVPVAASVSAVPAAPSIKTRVDLEYTKSLETITDLIAAGDIVNFTSPNTGWSLNYVYYQTYAPTLYASVPVGTSAGDRTYTISYRGVLPAKLKFAIRRCDVAAASSRMRYMTVSYYASGVGTVLLDTLYPADIPATLYLTGGPWVNLEYELPDGLVDPDVLITVYNYDIVYGQSNFILLISDMAFLQYNPWDVPGTAAEAKNPSYRWNLPAGSEYTAVSVYRVILTGDGDSLPDVILPVSNFQLRLRDGEPSYVSVVVPNATAYEAAISARTHGDIRILRGYRLPSGSTQYEEICRADFDSMQVDEGTASQSVQITAYRTATNSAPKEVTLSKLTYSGLQANGKRRYRGNLDLWLRPGDSLTVGVETIIIGQIYAIVSAGPPPSAYMEVTEAE